MARDVKLSLQGNGDVEEAYYQGLRAGHRVLLWYNDDNVWHDNLIGLVLGGEEVVLFTPDDDLYIEKIGCRGHEGPVRLRGLGPRLGYPRGLHGRIYRFRNAIDDDVIKRVIRDSINLVETETGAAAPIPMYVVDSSGNEKTLDEFFGGRFVHRRLRPLSAPTVGAGTSIKASVTAPVPKNAFVVKPASQDHVWLAAEPLGGLQLGQEVSLNAESDVQIGDHTAMTHRSGEWVKVEMVRIEEASAYAEKRRSLFKTVSFAETSEGLLERLQPPEKTKDAPPEGGEDNEVRTLWVDTDEQGERFKRWRDVCQESYTPSYEQKPLDGPLTALHTMKHMERHGGDPRLWLATWMRAKHIEPNDRISHELNVLTDCLYFAGCFDQINAPALICMEVVCRRIQAIADAYSNPSKPSWENARVFSGQGTAEDIISPVFRTYALKKNKDELELLQARIKVRELRGGPAASGEDVDESNGPGGPKPPKGGRKGGGRGNAA